MSRLQLVRADGQQLVVSEPEQESEQRPLTPHERAMWKLFGRPTARTGDLTRAQVELVWAEIGQRMLALRLAKTVKLVARPPLRLVGKQVGEKAGKRHERNHASQQ